MARRLLAIAFVLAALAPEAFVSAQQTSQNAATRSSASHTATASGHHSASPNASKKHHGNVPPWSNSVYVNGGNAAQYLATSTPKPPPGKNKVNTGGQVFKSISN
jgi:hypothetical protein